MVNDALFLICKHWYKHIDFLAQGGNAELAEIRKNTFFKLIKKSIPIDHMIYSDNPANVTISSGNLITISHQNAQETYFRENIGDYILIHIEYKYSIYTALYSKQGLDLC